MIIQNIMCFSVTSGGIPKSSQGCSSFFERYYRNFEDSLKNVIFPVFSFRIIYLSYTEKETFYYCAYQVLLQTLMMKLLIVEYNWKQVVVQDQYSLQYVDQCP